MLVRLCSKSFKLGFSSMWTKNFQMYKLGLEKAEGPEIKLPTFTVEYRKQGNSRKTFTCASLTAQNPLCSVQFSRSVVSNSLQPHESQLTRPPCPWPSPRVHSNSRLLSRWCHLAISSSVVPFSSCPQSLPASESFPMSQLFAWGGQNTGVSALASFLLKNTQGWSPLECTGWISLQSKGLWLCRSQQTVENSSRDRNTRPPNLSLENPVCRSRTEPYMKQLVQNWVRSMTRLYIVSLFI